MDRDFSLVIYEFCIANLEALLVLIVCTQYIFHKESLVVILCLFEIIKPLNLFNDQMQQCRKR